MRTNLERLLLPALAAVVLAGCAGAATPAAETAAAGSGHELAGRYSGVMVDVGNVLPRTTAERLTIWVDRVEPAAAAERLATLERKSGQTALQDALADHEVGRVQVDGGLSYPISAAFAYGDDGADLRHLVLIVNRPISIGEIFRGSRSVRYPFSVLELDVGPHGEGSGELNIAARLAFDDAGQVLIDGLAAQPLRILDVDRTS